MQKQLLFGLLVFTTFAAQAQEHTECTMRFKHGHSQKGDCEKLRKLLEKRGFIKVQIEPITFDTEEKKLENEILQKKALYLVTLENRKEHTLEDYALFPEDK